MCGWQVKSASTQWLSRKGKTCTVVDHLAHSQDEKLISSLHKTHSVQGHILYSVIGKIINNNEKCFRSQNPFSKKKQNWST